MNIKIIILLLACTGLVAQPNYVKLKTIEPAPSAGQVPITTTGGVQTYSLFSTLTAGFQPTIGYTPENQSNKATSFSVVNNTLYPSVQAVSNYITGLNYLTGSSAASTYVPLTRSITINGLSQDLTANRTWTVGDALTSNPLSQFAPTSSAQLSGVISDETGSGLAVFNSSPTFTNGITVNSGSFTGGHVIRDLVGTSTAGAIYMGVTPSASNYFLATVGTMNVINSTNNIRMRIGGFDRMTMTDISFLFTPSSTISGASNSFVFTAPDNSGQTASTNIPKFILTPGRTAWANGAITLQEAVRIAAPTYAHVSGSNTISEAGTLSVYAATTTGGFTSITNNYAIISNGQAKVTDNVVLSTAGKTISLKNGSNAAVGTATLSLGTVTVSNTNITSTSIVIAVGTGTTGVNALSTTNNPGVGFTITSSSPADSRTVKYFIVEQN